jgi:hypothetical protein
MYFEVAFLVWGHYDGILQYYDVACMPLYKVNC